MKRTDSFLMIILTMVLLAGCRSGSGDPGIPDSTTSSAEISYHADWSDITADGLDEASFYEKLDTDLLQEIAAKFQTLIEEEEAEERENPEIVITEGFTRIFQKEGYKEVISLGERAEMPLYFILYKSPNNGLYEYMCATALAELTGLDFMEESGAPYGWSNAKEYLELFNEYMAGRSR